MVLLKPACGSSSNLKCLENVLYHNTHWAPKVKEMPILTGAQAAEKNLSMMKTIPSGMVYQSLHPSNITTI